MSGETGSDGGRESLAVGIDPQFDGDELRDGRPRRDRRWIAISVVSLVALFLVMLTTGSTRSGENGVLAVALLIFWIGPAWEVHRQTDSTPVRLIGYVPGWNLLLMLGVGVLSFVQRKRKGRHIGAAVDEVERVIEEADTVASDGEYRAASETYDRARDAVEELHETAEDAGTDGDVALADALEALVAAKGWANDVDARFGGVHREIDRVERSRQRADEMVEEGDYQEALSAYRDALDDAKELQSAVGAEGGTRRFPSGLRSDVTDASSVEAVGKRVDDLVEDLEAGKEEALHGRREIEFEELLSTARSAGERGDGLAEDGDDHAAVDAYEEAIEAAEAARRLADDADVGDRDRARTILEDLRQRRGEAVLSALGNRLGSVPDDPDADEVEDALDTAESLLAEAESAPVTDDLKRERELLAVDAARRLVATAESGLGALADRAADRYEASDYDAARDEFDRCHRLASHVTETVGDHDVDTSDLATLVERCEHDADAARRAKLGIGDGLPSLAHPGNGQRLGDAPRADGPAPTAGAPPQGHDPGDVFDGYPVPGVVPGAPTVEVDQGSITRGERIGEGGNADVTLATVETSDGSVDVALKEPRIQGTAEIEEIQALVREAETWAKIDDHDHVVGVVDYSEAAGWIALEYMDAGDLSTRSGDLGVPQALWTAYAITSGVRHAHRRGIQHYDLKPANVLFRSVEGGWDVPKVTDWGLAKSLLDHSGTVEGYTPTYAAPEQLDADRYGGPDERTDVYQLGVVLYELFTGQPPFGGPTGAVVASHLEDRPDPPSSVATELPASLDDVLNTALAKEKDDRYESVLYLRDGLISVAEELL